jgi:hypothetical protein
MITIPPRRLLPLVTGFTLWASAFVSLYGVNAIACRFAWPRPFHRGILLLLLALHLVVLGWMTLRCWRRRRSQQDVRAAFIESVGLGLTIAALAATLLTFAPSLVLSTCG